MNLKVLFSALLILMTMMCFGEARSQDTSLVFGNKLIKQKINYYDFSDPLKINFEVIVWGGFKFPGKYLVPEGTTVIDLLTYAGFPPNSEILEDIKLLTTKDITSKFASSSIIKLNFKKFFDKETVNYGIENPLVKPGDILLMPLELEKGFWDYFKDAIYILGPIASILSLIVTVSK